MTTLLQRIKNDLRTALLNKKVAEINALRMILGELPRLNKKAGQEPTDKEIQDVIRKLIKSETQVVELQGGKAVDSLYISTLSRYIPKQMSKAQIETWIMDNIDLSQFNPKMKAMGPIMKKLSGKADGNDVKKILTEWS